jgi:group II intron reverse transcriptase/maturase
MTQGPSLPRQADFLPCSFGFRPRRATHDALQVLLDESWKGRRWIVESDIADCFEAIPHDRLMQAIQERIVDRHVLKLLRALLRAGVMEAGAVRQSGTGTPQGGVISPLLANVYLHRLDRAWQARGRGRLVCYADDLVVCCRSEREARDALMGLRGELAELGLAPKEAKTRIVHLTEGGDGLDFLGFHHRWVRARNPRYRHLTFLARWPSRDATQRVRDRLRDLTVRERLLVSDEQVVQELNRVLRGWANYFRYGNSARQFRQISAFAAARLARFVAKRHKRAPGYGLRLVHQDSPNRLGLITLEGAAVPPRPNRPWRATPNATR